MQLGKKSTRIWLAVIIIVSLALSFIFMAVKQGYHEDELLTYNLANSSKQLGVDGEWNSPEDLLNTSPRASTVSTIKTSMTIR